MVKDMEFLEIRLKESFKSNAKILPDSTNGCVCVCIRGSAGDEITCYTYCLATNEHGEPHDGAVARTRAAPRAHVTNLWKALVAYHHGEDGLSRFYPLAYHFLKKDLTVSFTTILLALRPGVSSLPTPHRNVLAMRVER